MSQGDFCHEVNGKWLLDSGVRRPGKNSQMRTFDHDGFRRRAGCIIFRSTEEEEILLVSSSSHQNLFIVPAGGVDPGETLCECAVREALEEAGVQGKLSRFIGVYEQTERRHRTAVFVMHVDEVLDVSLWKDYQQSSRSRAWFSLKEAYERLTLHPEQKEFIVDAIAGGPNRQLLGHDSLPLSVPTSTRCPPP